MSMLTATVTHTRYWDDIPEGAALEAVRTNSSVLMLATQESESSSYDIYVRLQMTTEQIKESAPVLDEYSWFFESKIGTAENKDEVIAFSKLYCESMTNAFPGLQIGLYFARVLEWDSAYQSVTRRI